MLFDKQFSIKRVPDGALDKVNQYGCIFIQFPTFTYLRVGYFKEEPYTLPRYATDGIILMELAKQVMEVQFYQHVLHRLGFGISSIVIGHYMINFVHKEKAMEAKLHLITLNKFKAKCDFDYREMNSKSREHLLMSII